MNKSRSDSFRLHDMLAAIDAIAQYTDGLDFAAFVVQRQVQHAVLFNMQVVGEAANRLDESLRRSYPAVPWTQMVGMRNVIVHGYFAVNLQIIWNTVTEDLPRLKPHLAAILAAMDPLR